MLKKIFPLFAAVVMLLTSCQSADTSTEGSVHSTDDPTDNSSYSASTADEILNEMTTEEKIAQLLFVRCDSSDIDGMSRKNPGGVVMFGVDFENLSEDEVKDKIEHLKDGSKIEPIIAVDEEGGTVVRVSSNPQLADQKFKSPRENYETGGMDYAVEQESEKSKLLADLGITMNLAPVADISTDPDDFMYSRSLGQDSATTAEFVSKTVNTMHENGIMSCLKHFPGYGGNLDTHTGISTDERPLSSFRENDFVPFKAGIDSDTDAILIAHSIVNDIDPDVPASISPAVHDILRSELGFTGIIITDDMSMGAMQNYIEPYKKAVLAGNDMLIVSDFDAAFNEILTAVNDGSISEEILNEAVLNILQTKDF